MTEPEIPFRIPHKLSELPPDSFPLVCGQMCTVFTSQLLASLQAFLLGLESYSACFVEMTMGTTSWVTMGKEMTHKDFQYEKQWINRNWYKSSVLGETSMYAWPWSILISVEGFRDRDSGHMWASSYCVSWEAYFIVLQYITI